MSLQNLKAYATRHGYIFQEVGSYDDANNWTPSGILIDHSYTGAYPTREAMDAHFSIWKYGTAHGYTVQNRGYYNGTALIIPEV